LQDQVKLPDQSITCLEAVRDAIAVEMRANPKIVLLGEGTGERGGSFGHTRDLWQEFGPKRLIDTPISELGFTGAAIGAAMTGLRPIVDLMFADFLAEAMSQIVNQAAKVNYLSNGGFSAPMVIRAPMGSLRGGGAHHSGCLYPWFMHIPGLKVVTFSTAEDGYGLMRSALNDDGPVLFMDHKALFNTKDDVSQDGHAVPLGVARVLREGTDATVVACGLMARRAVEAADSLAGRISLEVVDPRTLAPLDLETIFVSVEKTGRLLIVDESYPVCSLASEVSAAVSQHSFNSLDAPIQRLNSQPITHPIAPALEEAMIPQTSDIERAISELMHS
jgi:2-oxoisovalerate dehydrogenase E1 component